MTETSTPTHAELATRLAAAEQALDAIRSGEVDALVVTVDGAVKVYTLQGEESFYRALVEQMPEGAAAVSPDGLVLYANSCLAKMVARPLESLIGTELTTLVAPDDRPVLHELLRNDGSTTALELTVTTPDGGATPVAISAQRVSGYDDGTQCVVVVDLTSRRAAEAAVRQAEARFRGAFDRAPIGMALLGLDGLIEQANPALCMIARRTAPQLEGGRLPWLGNDEILAELARGEREDIELERRHETSTGRVVWASVNLTVVRGADGEPQHFIAQVQDISDRLRYEQQLRDIADHDGLTGLLNRRGFEQALAHHLALGARYGREGALILLDIDHFKYINDTRGHQTGDRVLADLAEAVRIRLRESDLVGRLGGDEFAVLLPRGDLESARRAATALVEAARSVEIHGLESVRQMSISAGVVPIEPGQTIDEVMSLADLVLYDAKDAGRDRALVHDPTRHGRSIGDPRLTFLGRLEAAIVTGDLLLHAQPIVELKTGRAVRHELLTRLPGPTGPIAAAQWFSIAERNGLATRIDEWVIDRAVELLAEERYEALNINVSAMSVGNLKLQERISSTLRRHRVDADRITFELTETAAIGNIAAALHFVEGLRTLGCRLALDDFGAGFGSFYYLKHLPIDEIKIDGEFVRDCVNSTEDRAIIGAMVAVADSMGRQAVAECIEDVATLALVGDQGVDLAQGYHLGPPVLVEL